MDNGTGLTKLGFAGNDSPSWIFPTAIANAASSNAKNTASSSSTGGAGLAASSTGGSSAASNPYFTNATSTTNFGNLTTASLMSNNLSGKRGTEDLDFYIGNEALTASQGANYSLNYPIRHGQEILGYEEKSFGKITRTGEGIKEGR